jgi:hypothetical protein
MSVFSSMGQAEARRRADLLAAELAGIGVPCKVEPRAALAVLMVETGVAQKLADGELRRSALALAREQGFTHLAVELAPPAAGANATLPRP